MKGDKKEGAEKVEMGVYKIQYTHVKIFLKREINIYISLKCALNEVHIFIFFIVSF